MLSNIVKELIDTENKAKKIIEDAQIEAKKMIEKEQRRLIEVKEKLITDYNEEGQIILRNRIDEAHKKAQEIHDHSEKEKTNLKKDLKDKFDQAVEIVLDQIVK